MGKTVKEVSDLLLLIPFIAGNQGVTVAEIARHFACSRAEVEENLNRILMCGVPPYLPDNYIGYACEGDRVYLSLAAHMSQPVRLMLEEALGLRLFLQALPRSRGGRSPVETLLRKIEAALPSGAGKEFRKMSRAIALAQPRRFSAVKFDALRKAVRGMREIEAEYYSASSERLAKHVVRPLGLLDHEGDWYLIALGKRGDRIILRVDRMKSVIETGKGFEPPKDFDIGKYKVKEVYFPGKKAIACRVKFSAELAPWVEERYDRRRLRRQKDGSVVLALKAASPEWLFRFLLKFGGDAHLLEPQGLRKEFRKTIDRLMAVYDVARSK
jgi:proteasome accessory factor C